MRVKVLPSVGMLQTQYWVVAMCLRLGRRRLRLPWVRSAAISSQEFTRKRRSQGNPSLL